MLNQNEILNKAMGRRQPARPTAEAPIRLARQAAGLSQEALAERAGVSLTMLCTYERMPTRITPRAAERLALALGCAVEPLLAPRLGRHQ